MAANLCDDVTCKASHAAARLFAGLSPQFWAYTPMMIGTLQTLYLVNGLNFFFEKSDSKFFPVSKCSLLGTILNVDRLGNGASLYLLDDGSGFVDCVARSNEENSIYSLPALVPSSGDDTTAFVVGDMVRVFGKIQCVSVGDNVREARSASGDVWEIRDCIREVQVSHIQKISPNERVSWNAEADHWLDSLRFLKRLQMPTSSLRNDQTQLSVHDENCCIRNGMDVLDLLGPEIAQQAFNHDDFPSADDTLGAWRVFGTSCKCRLQYMDSLLYCHCQATSESLDPQFAFRDHLLVKLLSMRDAHIKLRGSGIPFCFRYKAITNDEQVVQVAQETVRQTEKSKLYVHRLMLRTFAALRTDGILHLVDNESDMYMLVCKECVIEPYIRTMLDSKAVEATFERKFPLEEVPAYLAQIPERLQFVKRSVIARGQA